jgi:hypothetical protein
MGSIAFALRSEYAGKTEVIEQEGAKPRRVPTFQGGQIALPDGGETFDVGQKLQDGGGTIVVDSSEEKVIGLLREYPALKEVKAPDSAPAEGGSSEGGES